MNTLFAAVVLIAGYIVGAIPSGLIVGKLHSGIDLRDHGSKNIGFTNAWRVLGWKAAIPVLVLDVGKAWAATLFLPNLVSAEAFPNFMIVVGLAVLIGNLANVFLRFRGGKGVATGFGVFLALAPVAVLIALGTFLVVLGASRYVSLGSICASIALALAVFLQYGAKPVFWVTAIAATAIVFKHRANIRRLASGTENRVGKRSTPGAGI